MYRNSICNSIMTEFGHARVAYAFLEHMWGNFKEHCKPFMGFQGLLDAFEGVSESFR